MSRLKNGNSQQSIILMYHVGGGAAKLSTHPQGSIHQIKRLKLMLLQMPGYLTNNKIIDKTTSLK